MFRAGAKVAKALIVRLLRRGPTTLPEAGLAKAHLCILEMESVYTCARTSQVYLDLIQPAQSQPAWQIPPCETSSLLARGSSCPCGPAEALRRNLTESRGSEICSSWCFGLVFVVCGFSVVCVLESRSLEIKGQLQRFNLRSSSRL